MPIFRVKNLESRVRRLGKTLNPKLYTHSSFFGFTLVELMVAVSIIAIIAIMGISVYTNAGGKSKDAKRRADIDSISKTYEEQAFDSSTALYRALTSADFTTGGVPTPPEGGNYTGLIQTGQLAASFVVCATLEGGTPGCSVPSNTCYCRVSTQGSSTTSTPFNIPTNTPTPTFTPTPTSTPTPTPIFPPSIAYKRVFITSTTYNGNLGGLAGADQICNGIATTTYLGGTWKAWVSTGGNSPNDAARGFTKSTNPYKMLDGTTLDNSYAALVDGGIIAKFAIDERLGRWVSGAGTLGNANVWTGIDYSGGRLDPTCNGWTSNSAGVNGVYGITDKSYETAPPYTGWSGFASDACSLQKHLYCFEQ